MNSEHAAPGDDIAAVLDRLGADAVIESPPPPPLPSPARGPLDRPTRWLMAAAVVVVAGFGVTLLVTGGDDGAEIRAERTTGPTQDPRPDTTVPAPAETERADVTVVFRPDPDRGPGAFLGEVTNDDEQPWSWDCTVGDLFRWDGSAWVLVADAAIWQDDGTLRLYEQEVAIDCGPPARYLGPMVTEDRAMSPEWRFAGPSAQQLDEPGDYRLVVPDGTGRVAVGRFTIRGAGEPVPDPGAPFSPRPDDPNCTLLSSSELRDLTGVDPDDPTGPVRMSPQPCWVGDTRGDASYRIAPMDEARLAFDDPNVDDLGPATIEGADESRVARFPNSGRTGHLVMGTVIVGERAVVFTLGGDHSLDDDTAVRLATALAARLRG